MSQPSPKRTTFALSGLILIAACFLPYWNTLDNGFVYDDHYIVESNAAIRSLSVVDIVASPFWKGFASETAGTYYRPFTILTYAVDYAISPAPFQFHLTNLLIHTLTTLLVFLLARRLIRSQMAALLAGVVFAVHPVHTEAVSNIAGRSDLLVGMFFVITLLLFIHRSPKFRLLYGLPLMLAVCSKEIGLVIPIILVSCDMIWPRSPQSVSPVSRWGHRLGDQIPSAIVVAAFVFMRWTAVGNLAPVVPSPLDNPLIEHGFLASCYTLPAIFAHYTRLLIFPLHLSVDYGFSQIPVETTPGIGLLLLIALLSTAYACRDRLLSVSPTVLAGASILLLPLLLTANPFIVTGSILSERYLYLPSVGLVLIIAAFAHRFRPGSMDAANRLKWGWILLVAVGFSGGLRTADRNLDWKNDETLFASAAAVTSRSVRANLNYAEVLSARGDYLSAAKHYEQVLELKADYPIVNLKLARALQGSGQPNKALHYYRTTTRLNPGLAEAWRGLGSLSLNLGDDRTAEEAYHSALNLDPRNASLHNQLGVIYQKRGENAKAVAAFEQAIAGNYAHPGVFCNLGVVYRQTGEIAQAREAFDRALSIAPELPLVHVHMGSLEQESGNPQQAILHYEKFLDMVKLHPSRAGDPGIAKQVIENLAYLRQTS